VTTGPPDERAAPRGRLRASHADREQAISALKIAFVQDRLAKDEFDARVGQVLVSRTHAELAVITADIPVDPVGVRPSARSALGVKSGICVTALAALLAAVLWSAAWSVGSAAAGAAALAVSGIAIFTLSVTGYQMSESRLPSRSAGLPPGTAS